MTDTYEVLLDGGGPWGIRLQGGKDFGVPLNVARVTPGSKAAVKGILAGDGIIEINGIATDSLSHMDAQNTIKQSGSRLQLRLKKGKGVSLGEIKQVGSGGFAAQPSKTLYTTNVTHSAGVDHKYNAKPKAFGAATGQTAQSKKFDPAEYAKRKKEELEKYKEEQNKPVVPDSDVLKMLQNTKINDNNQAGGGSFSKLQDSLNNEGGWAEREKSFRMTADGTDLSNVSPGSQSVIDDVKKYGSAGLSHSGMPSGGSRSFKVLQQMTDDTEDRSPPAPLPDDGKPKLSMVANNPYHLPIKAVVSNEGNPIMDSLKSKMKEMNINKDRIDRTSSVSNENKGKYLSQSSRESAARSPSPLPPALTSPTSPSFKMTLAKGESPYAAGAEANYLMASLKNQIQGDRMTLGLRQTRGLGASPSMNRMKTAFKEEDKRHNNPDNEQGYCNVLPPDFSSSNNKSKVNNTAQHVSVQDALALANHLISTHSSKIKSQPSSGGDVNDDTLDLPPPPPELMGGSNAYGFDEGPKAQSGTFKRLQQMTDSGDGDQVRTVFDQAQADRGQPVYAGQKFTPAPKTGGFASMPTGPNFRVGRASAPSFKPVTSSYIAPKGPPPPAVNAGEVVNTNSKLYQGSNYPQSPPAQSGTYQPSQQIRTSPASSSSNIGGSNAYQPRSPTANATPGVFNPAANRSPKPFSSVSAPAPAATVQSYTPPAPPQQQQQSHAPPATSAAAPQGEGDLYCGACQQPLSGPFVSAIGKTWHPDHFCCSSCNLSLQNQAFVEENNQLFCEKCYNSYYAPKCAHCNNAIIGNCINALGKSWHPDHFVCSFCNRGFGNEGFLVDSGKPYCEKCFEDLFSVKCGKCMRAITGGEKYVEALNKNWHSQCFTCNQCSSRLEGNSFFVSRGMPYCQNHKGGM